MATASLQKLLTSDGPLFAAWMMMGSSIAVEVAGADGWDLVLVDQQHGVPGGQTLVSMLTAARAAELPALVRVSQNDVGLIGQALDMGAHGVVCPMVNTQADAQRFVRAMKYPPLGDRSFGPIRGALTLGAKDAGEVNGLTVGCAQIETAEAVKNLDDILGVDGLDMICVGPNDLSMSMSAGEKRDIWLPEKDGTLKLILERARAHGVHAWTYANDGAYARMCVEMGWDIVTIGADLNWLSVGGSTLRAAAGDAAR